MIKIFTLLLAMLLFLTACSIEEDAGVDANASNPEDAPIANAGEDFYYKSLDSFIDLDGSASLSPVGLPLTYSWEVVSQPNASSVVLSPADDVYPRFKLKIDGNYQFRLTISDGSQSHSDDVFVLGPVSPLKTGQTTVYETYDDGHYQKGTDRNFTRDDSLEIVTDNVSGLQWQDDTLVWMNHADALSYCSSLSMAGHSDWALPTTKELSTLVYANGSAPVIDNAFSNTASSYYWSATSVVSGPTLAFYTNFSTGLVYVLTKTDGCYVRCVRARQ